MNQLSEKLQGLETRLLNEIHQCALNGDIAQIKIITPLVEKCREHKDTIKNIQRFLDSTENVFTGPIEIRGQMKKKLKITIHWGMERINMDDETICESYSSETLSKFISRLVQEFGEVVLRRIKNIKTGRGPLVSDKPDIDFQNNSSCETYAHSKIVGTDYSVITNSDNDEKVRQVSKIVESLALHSGFVDVSLVAKFG
jgi:hypothetical protein